MHQGDEEGETVGSKRLEALRHPIVVAFAGAFFGVLLGGISTWLTLRNASPVAKIIPLNPELKANESITFDARGSHDADGDRLAFQWNVGANSPSDTHVGVCNLGSDSRVLACRFVMPGVHVVSVTVTDPSGSKATASSGVKVEIPGGYIGLVLKLGSGATDSNFIKAFNYAVDWPAVQALVPGRPIVLYDPDRSEPVFAVTVMRSIEKAKEHLTRANQSRHVGLLMPLSRKEIVEQIQSNLKEADFDIKIIPISFGDAQTALTRGLSDSGFILLTAPSRISEFYR